MKKIALLLAMAIAFTSVATAVEVTTGGWMDLRGDVKTDNSDGKTSEEKKGDLENGPTEVELGVTAVGENFGGRIGFIHWSGENGNFSDAPYLHNTYIYSDFVPGKVRMYAGVQMFPFMYTAWAPVEHNSMFADNNGLGLGAFNYAGLGKWTNNALIQEGYTRKPTGLALEVKPVDGFEALVVMNNETSNGNTINFEDAVVDNLIFAGKYSMDMGTFYGGFVARDSANALWVEADLKLVENLTSGVKFEMIMADDDSTVVASEITAITLNAGYNVPNAVKVGFQSTTLLMDKDKVGVDSYIINSLSIAPVVPVVNPTIFAYYNKGSESKTDEFGVKLNVAKSIGQVTNNFYIEWDGDNADSAKSITTVGYKTTLWF